MKSLVAPSICLVAVGAVLAGGYGLASYAGLRDEPHHFANLDAQFWTTTPRRVDPRTQNYERLPPQQTATDNSQAPKPANLVGVTAIAPPNPTETVAAEPPKQEWIADHRHISLCQQRYRSYNVTDNSYQPFDGGPRAPCVTDEKEVSAELPAAETIPSPHAAWCAARYSSYRPSDNSYQPFSGSRRQCVSPVV